jgi:ATP-grasp ribosomal peptide maturase
MGNGPVLVVTAVDDITADMVIAELNRRGVPVIRLDPSDIGDDLAMSARFGVASGAPSGRLDTPSRSAALDAVRSVYWRRPSWPVFDGLSGEDARHSAAQVRHGLGVTLYSLAHCRYVNHPLSNHAAEFKPRQLAVAQRFGFTVPPTLVSNKLDDIREFIAEYDGVIYKALRWTPYRRNGQGWSTWTEPVEAGELDSSVSVVPHLFQARIDKVADVRVTVIGDRVYAVRIDSDLLDWRTDYAALTYATVTLPQNLEKSLVAYLAYFDLTFGCFDLCLGRDGKYYWIELNPNGQWGWLEGEAGIPLTTAFADLLEQGMP